VIQEETMARYPLSLPTQLKQEAETLAAQQGVSLNQFILWAVAEKVGALGQKLDDPAFPQITYRRGAAGIPAPTLRGTRIQVGTLAVMSQQWGWSAARIADEYGVSELAVSEGLAFYEAHRAEVDSDLAAEQALESVMSPA
jgi:uncharacterized protein (DUF433 family)